MTKKTPPHTIWWGLLSTHYTTLLPPSQQPPFHLLCIITYYNYPPPPHQKIIRCFVFCKILGPIEQYYTIYKILPVLGPPPIIIILPYYIQYCPRAMCNALQGKFGHSIVYHAVNLENLLS